MKPQVLALAAAFAALAFNTAQAANSDGCFWYTGGSGSQKRYFSMTAPSAIELKSAPVGSVMATAPKATIHTEIWQIKCPFPATPNYHGEHYIADGELADGFTDVYKTGIPGVGVRFMSAAGNASGSLPLKQGYRNSASMYINVIKSIQLEFIRTSRDVSQGTATMNFRIEQDINGWNAAQILVAGSTKLETRSYFSGCAGVEKLTIPMGRVSIGDIGKQQKSFNLDVLCAGMPAGTKIPVRVYFEGNSSGPGRLNLDAGGATGVEISLSNGSGALLPFSRGSALSMGWINSQPGGELYRLPVNAAYARKAGQQVKAGMANATLNYIIEYD
ncbi:fimbrial protein [Pseudomonas sp. B11]|nr:MULTISPECIES: fimbrial protein [unclassified Pseudomonas]QIH08274.1 fimbrial protein [Pseudomonas sp. BIOMIG1BAC]